MPDTKISGLISATTPLSGTEAIPLVQSGVTKQVASSVFQPQLVSGTNIKTVNGNSLLGSGDLAISGGGSSTLTIQNKTAAYTVVAGDLGTIINCTSGTFTVSLTAAATLGAGFNCWVWNTSNTATDAVTIDPNGSETIDGVSTLILRRGEGTQIICDGTNWQTGDKKTMRGYAENIPVNETKANASGSYAVAIGPAATASGTTSYAVGYLSSATGIGSLVLGGGCFASSNYSTAIGKNSSNSASQAVTGSGAMALGGSYASGTDSFAAAVANSTNSYGATGANSVAIGKQAKATATGSVAIGNVATSTGSVSYAVGNGATASGSSGCYAFGISATASANNSFCFGNSATASAISSYAAGESAFASGQYSFAFGYFANSAIYGKQAFACGTFASLGDAQTGTFVLRSATTDATAKVLTTSNSAASTTNQVILPNNSAYAFTGIVVARQQAAGGTASAAWKVEGLIRREANAASTTLVASTVAAISNVPGWTLALSADTTNGGIAITATGAAATNIRWVATIQTSEVTYA